MTSTINLEPVLRYLAELSKNNNKTWFEQHRADYEAGRRLFEQFIDIIIDEFRAEDDLQDLSARDCIGRIYRDIRFSRDKSPYRTNMWATVAPGGKHAPHMGYYIAIQPEGQSIVAGGMWDPSPEQLGKYRQAIHEDAEEFKAIIQARSFVENFGMLEGEKLKTAPQGYDKSHPEIELLKFKQIMAVRHYPDNRVTADDFLSQVITACRAMRPFINFMDQFK